METKPTEKPFLTTHWSHLAMLNYELDPATLAPFVPSGTELDSHQGRTFASMVGFLYHDTRVCGWAVPWHRHFAEVNLRFYVRRFEGEELRRGVVFIKEIVPRRAVARIARVLYDENFVAMPMRYSIEHRSLEPSIPSRAEFGWRAAGQWNDLAVATAGDAALPEVGSEEEFITEHYWGYTARRDGGTSEYRVDHPQWRVWQAASAEFHCDVATLYGKQFTEPLSKPPSSAFLAEGSPVVVYRGRRLPVETSYQPTPA